MRRTKPRNVSGERKRGMQGAEQEAGGRRPLKNNSVKAHSKGKGDTYDERDAMHEGVN